MTWFPQFGGRLKWIVVMSAELRKYFARSQWLLIGLDSLSCPRTLHVTVNDLGTRIIQFGYTKQKKSARTVLSSFLEKRIIIIKYL